MEDRLVSVAETAKTLGVSRITTRRLIKRGPERFTAHDVALLRACGARVDPEDMLAEIRAQQ